MNIQGDIMPKRVDHGPIPDRLLSTGDIARYCHTGITQVNRWIKSGELNAIQNPGGHYRVTKESFREFLERNGMPVVEEFFRKPRKRILIVDDDPAVIKAYSMLLKNRYDSVELETASDGYEALIKAGSFKPDLLILDIRMPRVNGLEVCRRLRGDSNTKGIKILAITAHSESYNHDTVLAAGADEYLLKPINMETLLAYVEKLM
jgi:two-component system, OmpR family, response regulator VicR